MIHVFIRNGAFDANNYNKRCSLPSGLTHDVHEAYFQSSDREFVRDGLSSLQERLDGLHQLCLGLQFKNVADRLANRQSNHAVFTLKPLRHCRESAKHSIITVL